MDTADTDLSALYQALKHNRGREQVSDANVDALIAMAQQYGDSQLELLLREWRSPCGDDPQAPALPQTLPPP